jgi:hypothetical protein
MSTQDYSTTKSPSIKVSSVVLSFRKAEIIHNLRELILPILSRALKVSYCARSMMVAVAAMQRVQTNKHKRLVRV